MELQAVHAIYENGRLIFTDPNTAPSNGSEVLVTYFVRASKKTLENIDPILKLRGRGKGEHLVDVGFESLRAIPHVAGSENSDGAFTELARYCSDPTVLVTKADIVRVLSRSVGSFQHIETGVNLDQRL